MPSKTEKQQSFFKAVAGGYAPKPKGMSWEDVGKFTHLQEKAMKKKLKNK